MSDDTQLAERSAKPVDVVRGALERLKPQFAMALPKHITPDRLVRIAMTAVQRTPKLLECDRASFYGAIMSCAQLGLEPDGVLGQAYLIPYRGKVQLVPGYRGLLTLARNSGEISYIAAHEVRENDRFDFDFASGEPPVHKFSLKEERGEVIAFYAIARFRDGSFYWDMMTVAEVNDIRDGSDGYRGAVATAKKYNKDKPDSPWVEYYVEMGKKTTLRRLSKYLPLSVQKAAEIDAQVNAGHHVTLDRYGDLVIEGESKEVAEEVETAGPSKLDRFDERHGGAVDLSVHVPQETEADPETGEISPDADTELPGARSTGERQDEGSDTPPASAPRPGDDITTGHEMAPDGLTDQMVQTPELFIGNTAIIKGRRGG